jgi:hypothetical protein
VKGWTGVWNQTRVSVTARAARCGQCHTRLSADLWTQVCAELDARCEGEDLGGLTPTEEEARQWRIARAAILLMGDSGVRRDEAANARRENLSVAVVTSGGLAKTSANGSTRSSPKSRRKRPGTHTKWRDGLGADRRWQAPQATHGACERGSGRRAACALGRSGTRLRCPGGRVSPKLRRS